MREGDQSTREQMETLVCMSLEEMESSVYTAGTVAAFHPHLDCGDVMCLILVERIRVSISTSAMVQNMVSKTIASILLIHRVIKQKHNV